MPIPVATLAGNEPAPRQWPRPLPVAAASHRHEDDIEPAQLAPSAGGWFALTIKIVLGAFGIGLALALAMLGLVLISNPALAHDGPREDRGDDGGDGAMLMLERCGRLVPAPLLSSETRITVTGPVLRARVVQRFVNAVDPVDSPDADDPFVAVGHFDPFEEPDGDDAHGGGDADDAAMPCEPAFIEATYLFPLADGAAVDHLRLVVGERVIEGRIHEREAAAKAHETARAQGRRSALLESRRPNVFSSRVANIAPGETVAIEIEYQQTLAPADEVWAMHVPSVVAPRYSREPGGGDLAQPYLAATGRGPSPAAARHTLTLSLDPGVPIVAPRSPSHRITTEAPQAGGPRHWRIAVDEADPGDRDFVLEWQARTSALPRAALRLESFGDETFGLLIVDPPRGDDGNRDRLPRETTFVIDTSGSMGGQSIEQARSALLFALDRLMPGDAFNLIAFNSRHRKLFEAPVVVDQRTLATARRWVRGLRAEGGTEMHDAIAAALAQPPSEGRLGQVIFITDGAIDYEEDLVTQIGETIGERRLFTVAIGSAPNGWFLRKAAETGGGTLTRIGTTDEVERRMAALFTRLARPASTDLALEISGAELLQDPHLPRDLYAGDPLVAVLRLSGEPGLVRLKGRHHAPWEMAVDVARVDPDADAAPGGAGVHALWARREIEAIDDRLQQGGIDAGARGELRRTATTLALSHHLVSRYTSLVAVDDREARPSSSPLVDLAVPAPMPAGWTLAQTATPAALQLLLGSLLLVGGFALIVQRRVCAWLAAVTGGSR